MFKFTKTSFFCMAVGIMFCLLQVFICQYSIKCEINKEIMQIDEMSKENIEKVEIWQIEIPKILLNSNILEGTTNEVLNQYVGHFESTTKQFGNIGLALYSIGNDKDYFKNLKLLEKGDEIKYKYNNFEKIYEVEKCRIIKEDELQYLDESEDNKITLITYVENQPEYRRCIQAIEKEVEIY